MGVVTLAATYACPYISSKHFSSSIEASYIEREVEIEKTKAFRMTKVRALVWFWIIDETLGLTF
jgi:hypothetical protein